MDAHYPLSEISCGRPKSTSMHPLSNRLMVFLMRRQLRLVRQTLAGAMQGAAWMRARPLLSSWASRQRCRAGSLCSRGRCAGLTRLGMLKQCASRLLSFKHAIYP